MQYHRDHNILPPPPSIRTFGTESANQQQINSLPTEPPSHPRNGWYAVQLYTLSAVTRLITATGAHALYAMLLV